MVFSQHNSLKKRKNRLNYVHKKICYVHRCIKIIISNCFFYFNTMMVYRCLKRKISTFSDIADCINSHSLLLQLGDSNRRNSIQSGAVFPPCHNDIMDHRGCDFYHDCYKIDKNTPNSLATRSKSSKIIILYINCIFY